MRTTELVQTFCVWATGSVHILFLIQKNGNLDLWVQVGHQFLLRLLFLAAAAKAAVWLCTPRARLGEGQGRAGKAASCRRPPVPTENQLTHLSCEGKELLK